MPERESKVHTSVDLARRELLKRLAAGAAFAAPVIATLSIEALTSETAVAQSATCTDDVGYDGPLSFQAHVSAAGVIQPASFRGSPPRVNGEVLMCLNMATLAASGYGNGTVNSITGDITTAASATVSGGGIYIGGRLAAHITTAPSFSITNTNLDTRVVCDLDELADTMASGGASITINGTYNGTPFSASGNITVDDRDNCGPVPE